MKRKTNLFYTTGPDSKFLTFSNYTEYLTGNFLSSNYKMFPSKFLCVNIDLTDEEGAEITKRETLIKDYLVKYYENKLAFLREDCYLQNNNTEIYIHPLEYLFDTLYKFDEDFSIPYIGAITEQDYNGAYTDSICIVDMNDPIYGEFINNESSNSSSSVTTNVKKKLSEDEYYVGWVTDSSLNELYGTDYDDTGAGYTKSEMFDDEHIEIVYDTVNFDTYEKQYNYESKYYENKILTPITNNQRTLLKFNCIIPLFDIVEINKETNSNEIFVSTSQQSSVLNTNNIISTVITKDNYVIHDVPFGIWIADQTVEIYKDNQTNQFPSWSLTISSQFKPLPYFKGSESSVIDTNDHVTNEFATFAQIMSRQNTVMNTFNDMTDYIYELKSKISSIEDQLSILSSIISNLSNNSNILLNTTSIFDNLTNDMVSYKAEMDEKFDNFQKEVKENLKHITWQTTI